MASLIYIVNVLLQYFLVTAFLLRLLLPLVRADMRNPLSQAVLRFTNPIVLPLRRLLPPIGRVDTASVLALILAQTFTIAVLVLLSGGIGMLSPLFLLKVSLWSLLLSTLRFYSFAVLFYALLGWITPGGYNPMTDILSSLCEPLMQPIRRLIPPIAGLDFTPVFVLIAIQAVLIALPQPYF
jgi:YggT family protein